MSLALLQPPPTRKTVTPMVPFYQENKLTLWQVQTSKPLTGPPILLIPAMINRHYILDLNETNSVCAELTKAGYPVFLLDWGAATPEDRWVKFSDIFLNVLPRINRKIQRHTGQKPVLLGYCMGGTMATIYTACFPNEVAGLIALTAPIDFSKAGVMSLWTQKQYLDTQQVVDAIGNLPPDWTQNSFVSLRPANWRQKWQKAWQKQDDLQFMQSFWELENWVNDNVPFPGGIWQEYIQWLYQENRLLNDSLSIGTHAPRLADIQCPVLTIVAEQDHIVPYESAAPLHDKVGSQEKERLTFTGGHVGIIASPKAFPKFMAAVLEWLKRYVA